MTTHVLTVTALKMLATWRKTNMVLVISLAFVGIIFLVDFIVDLQERIDAKNRDRIAVSAYLNRTRGSE